MKRQDQEDWERRKSSCSILYTQVQEKSRCENFRGLNFIYKHVQMKIDY